MTLLDRSGPRIHCVSVVLREQETHRVMRADGVTA